MDQTQTSAQSSLQLTPEIQAFLDSCLWDKGIKDLPQEMHDQMIRNLAARLEAWLMQAAFMHMDDQASADMEKMMSAEPLPSQQQITQFLTDHIPDLPKVYEQAMFEFKQTYLKG